ncbi:tetratricopeptide repeat protein [Thiomicrospira sp.]|uniref:tetratricopeptide repeat protein n=1 Tax=Thiomicrospira sp. TaxID=935 RepID=UPI002F91C0AE
MSGRSQIKQVVLLGLYALIFSGCATTQQPLQSNPSEDSKPLADSLTEQAQFDFALDMVRLQMDRSEWDQAEKLLLKLRRSHADEPEVFRLLGRVYEAKQQLELAYITREQLLKLEDKTRADEADFARTAIQLERYQAADAVYQAWLLDTQSHVKVAGLNNLGFSALLQGELTQAKTYFNQALELDPLNQKSRNNLALLHQIQEPSK